ncbi:unnamed protein product [Effrenium voratum]|nr:unnamed protein product [Effrenium voratum]
MAAATFISPIFGCFRPDPQHPDTAFFTFLTAKEIKEAQEKGPRESQPQADALAEALTVGSASSTFSRASLSFAVPFLSDVGREHRPSTRLSGSAAPREVGMPIGQGQKWFALQMHYYNPSLHTGVTDSSGVRISLADSVRTYDAGAFRFNGGTGPSMRAALPPGVPLLTVKQALLPAACTNEWQEDVNVLGVVYHAHLVGKRLNIEVLRGSESLGELRKEKLYDFNHQSLEPASVKTLKKGDQLVMTCTYDTSSRTTPTQFGDSTQTEMCWSAFMYYPVQKMNRVLFTSEDWMLCEGAAQQYHANTIPSIPASTCQAVGDVGSQTALDLLASMGVNVTGVTVTERPSTSSTSPEGLSVSASTTASGWLLAVWAFGAF